jgi:hypothetical protein
MNPDFSRVISLGREFRKPPSYPSSQFVARRMRSGQGTILRRAHPYELVDGAKGFWELVESGLTTGGMMHFEPECVIIDTNLHVANLVKRSRRAYAAQDRIRNLLDKHNIHHVYLWFMWTLAAIYDTEGLAATSIALRNLTEGGAKCPTNLPCTMIHVLNPHAFVPPLGWGDVVNLLTARRHEVYYVEGLKDLVGAEPVDEIDFKDIHDELSQRLGEREAEYVRWEHMFIPLTESMIEEFRGRPRNVFSISAFSSELAGLTEAPRRRHPQTIGGLAEQLNPVYRQVSEYLREL